MFKKMKGLNSEKGTGQFWTEGLKVKLMTYPLEKLSSQLSDSMDDFFFGFKHPLLSLNIISLNCSYEPLAAFNFSNSFSIR